MSEYRVIHSSRIHQDHYVPFPVIKYSISLLTQVDMSGFEFFLEGEADRAAPIHLTKDGVCALGSTMAHAYENWMMSQGGAVQARYLS